MLGFHAVDFSFHPSYVDAKASGTTSKSVSVEGMRLLDVRRSDLAIDSRRRIDNDQRSKGWNNALCMLQKLPSP